MHSACAPPSARRKRKTLPPHFPQLNGMGLSCRCCWGFSRGAKPVPKSLAGSAEPDARVERHRTHRNATSVALKNKLLSWSACGVSREECPASPPGGEDCGSLAAYMAVRARGMPADRWRQICCGAVHPRLRGAAQTIGSGVSASVLYQEDVLAGPPAGTEAIPSTPIERPAGDRWGARPIGRRRLLQAHPGCHIPKARQGRAY